MTGAASEMHIDHIGVVGAGAWGTALAQACARAGRRVTLWARDADHVAALARARENAAYLPGIGLDDAIVSTADMQRLAAADALLLVVPAQALRGVASSLSAVIGDDRPVVICAKGIERGSGALMCDVLAEALPAATPAILSGPSFAADVARGLPTAVTLAARDADLGEALVRAIGHTAFRPYLTDDIVGVEIGGAMKNVLAIACGIVAGKKLGASAGAALTARGFAELVRFGTALGARPETLSGLSGLGDLILTATSPQSRNFALGTALGAGGTIEDAARDTPALAEGMWTAGALMARADDLGVDLPISSAVSEIVAGRLTVDAAIETLLARPFRREG